MLPQPSVQTDLKNPSSVTSFPVGDLYEKKYMKFPSQSIQAKPYDYVLWKKLSFNLKRVLVNSKWNVKYEIIKFWYDIWISETPSLSLSLVTSIYHLFERYVIARRQLECQFVFSYQPQISVRPLFKRITFFECGGSYPILSVSLLLSLFGILLSNRLGQVCLEAQNPAKSLHIWTKFVQKHPSF